MKTLLLMALVLMAGCQSLPSKTIETVQEGDSVKRLYALYGEPTFNLISIKTEGARAYYYVIDNTVCGYAIKNEEVIRVGACLPFTWEAQKFLNSIAEKEVLPQYKSLVGGSVTSVEITYHQLTKKGDGFKATGFCAEYQSMMYCWDDGVKSVTRDGFTTHHSYWGLFADPESPGELALGNVWTKDYMPAGNAVLVNESIRGNLEHALTSPEVVINTGTPITLTCTIDHEKKVDCGSFKLDTRSAYK
jgi:hypothetical protein